MRTNRNEHPRKKIIPDYSDVDCVICGRGAESEQLYVRPDYVLQTTTHEVCFDVNYRICRGCGLVYMAPQLSQSCWREYLKNDCFTTMPEKVDMAAYNKKISLKTKNFFSRHLRPGSRLLEIGCGDGHYLYYLKHTYGCEALGIDLSNRYCDYAKETLRLPVENISLEDFDSTPGSFDVILSHHVFEHLANPVHAFRKANDLLKEGGFLVIEVPSVHFPAFSIRDMYCAHNFLFSPVTMRKAIETGGFSVIMAEEDVCLKYVLQKTKSPPTFFENDYQTVRKSVIHLLEEYQETYSRVSKRMEEYISDWREHNTPIAIWGAGEHTVSVFSDFDLSECNIQYIIDSNSQLWGTSFNDYKIVSPEELKVESANEVLISSKPFEREIEETVERIAPGVKIKMLYR